ncbi:Tensin-4 [Fasciola gigantica]|uniref:Tensin-4 n=1 Tax=Fasciola gigantica TaxID=46835 RepID=A0A504YA67_FASGI|nr:Tensin-4 [Fasciola gigantica]
MAVQSLGRSKKLDEIEADLPNKSLLNTKLGIFSKNETVVRRAEYIGSFLVTGKGHHERAEIVRQKLESARAYTHSKPILLLISLQGIKVCRENNEHVYMAHALRRISYATCDPDNLQFAFLAREPKAQPNIQYCHAFVTNVAEEAEELNNIVGEAFRVAYAQQRLAVLSEQMRNAVLSPSKTSTTIVSSVLQNEKCTPSPRVVVSSQQVLTTVLQSTELTNGSKSHPTVPKHSSPLRLSIPDSGARVALLDKPLPPVPGENVSSDGALNDSPLVTAVETTIVSETSNTETTTATATDGLREHKPHKHHKHHKHRHRHKTRDGTTLSSATADSGVSVSADSGRHTETSESLADGVKQCPKEVPISPAAIGHRSVQPPPPPPRGSSSLTACLAEEQPASNGHLAASRSVGVESASNVIGMSSRPLSETLISLSDLPTVAFPDLANVRNASQSSLVGRTKQISISGSRPHSQHSYDMADHRSCGGMVTASTASADVPHCTAFVSSLSGHPIHTSTVITASSSTTGCSTTTSESTRSGSGSGHSLPGPRRNGASGPGSATENRSAGSGGSYPNSSRHSLSRLPLPPEVVDPAFAVLQPTGQNLTVLDESAELSQAPWYQPHVPREVALEILSKQPPGSFVIRDSGSHANCYALSVRFGEGAGRCSVPGLARVGVSHGCSASGSGSAYPFTGTGISHFLIQRTPRGGVRLKGLDKEWPSLACLVLHLTVMPEMLPCPLRLPRAAANPAFDADERVDGVEINTPGPSCAHFRPILDIPLRCGDGLEVRTESGAHSAVLEDEDYQRLSDFSSIMADLQPRTRSSRRRVR